jgi:poly-gamma-glutamate synthesis protein (capsule biosynthesis protein)
VALVRSKRYGGKYLHHTFYILLILFSSWLASFYSPVVSQDDSVIPNSDWFYLREGQPLKDARDLSEILIVGDVMLGRSVAGQRNPFDAVSRELNSADLTFANLEGVIQDGEDKGFCSAQGQIPEGYRILFPRKASAQLQQAGFDLLGIANNHALDCGYEGLRRTVQQLEIAGIRTAGAGPGLKAAYQPDYWTINGLRIGFLVFNSISSPQIQHYQPQNEYSSQWQIAEWNREIGTQAVQIAKETADFVIVSIHWGDEYNFQANSWQRRTAQEIVDAGADLVIGHHPHVIQETQVLEKSDPRKPIAFVAYSLGNFVFDQFDPETQLGIALRVWIDRLGLRAVQALPVHSGPHPRWFQSGESTTWLERSRPKPKSIGFACDNRSCAMIPIEEPVRSGLFTSGRIDLTGDGEAEVVRLIGERAVVYQEDKLVWQSPPDWRVNDLSLGDPNDDGRFELLLSVRKLGPNKNETSQPFIIGYRSGVYRQLWGGSPVAEPIREVELGDVDGDGVEELVVIDEAGLTEQSVSVWKWHGWGFSLFWRSELERYEDLSLVKGTDDRLEIHVGLNW